MSKEKQLRQQICELILRSTEQEMMKSDFMKIVSEEWDSVSEELFERTTERSQEEREFREKAVKVFKYLKQSYTENNFGHTRPSMVMFWAKAREKNCLEILCVYYSKGIQDRKEVYSELEERLQIKRESIRTNEKFLYRSIAKYYDITEKEILTDKIVQQEKLKDFIEMIERN